jgi:hypothetical protein
MAGRVGELAEVLVLGQQDSRLGVSQSGDDMILGSGGYVRDSTDIMSSSPQCADHREVAALVRKEPHRGQLRGASCNAETKMTSSCASVSRVADGSLNILADEAGICLQELGF